MTFIFRLLLQGPEILNMIRSCYRKTFHFFSFDYSYVFPRASKNIIWFQTRKNVKKLGLGETVKPKGRLSIPICHKLLSWRYRRPKGRLSIPVLVSGRWTFSSWAFPSCQIWHSRHCLGMQTIYAHPLLNLTLPLHGKVPHVQKNNRQLWCLPGPCACPGHPLSKIVEARRKGSGVEYTFLNSICRLDSRLSLSTIADILLFMSLTELCQLWSALCIPPPCNTLLIYVLRYSYLGCESILRRSAFSLWGP